MLPTIENCSDVNVFIPGETKSKLDEKIYKGLEQHFCNPKFTSKSAAWIIAYQNPDWFGYVLKSVTLEQINGILFELNLILNGDFKFNNRIAEKITFFVNIFKNIFEPEILEKTKSIFAKHNCASLSDDYVISAKEIDSAIKMYDKYCKMSPYIVWTYGTVDILPSKLKPYAVKNYLFASEHNTVDVTKWNQSYTEYIKANLKTYVKMAEENDYLFYLLLEEKMLSHKMASDFLSVMQKNEKFEASALLLEYIEKIKPVINKDPFSENSSEIKRKIAMQERKEAIKNNIGISGIVFVASGELKNFGCYDEYTGAHNLSDLQRFIEESGGILRSSVSGKTDYLICNNTKLATTKIKKAQELGVTIISEKEFLVMAEK